MHLAYVPLIRREASTCKESSHTSWTLRKLCNMIDKTFFAATACVCGQSAERTPKTEEKSMCCARPSCRVDSRPGPADCSALLTAAVCAIYARYAGLAKQLGTAGQSTMHQIRDMRCFRLCT